MKGEREMTIEKRSKYKGESGKKGKSGVTRVRSER